MARKFILHKREDNPVLGMVFGNVDYHENLLSQVTPNIKRDDVTGGGWFHVDSEKKEVILFGLSVDFGPFLRLNTEGEILEACKQSSFFTLLDNHTVRLSSAIKFEELEKSFSKVFTI